MSTVQLQSSDGHIFSVGVEAAKKFGLIKNMLENFGTEGKADEILPIMRVDAEILEMVIKWAEHHARDNVTEKTCSNSELLHYSTDDITEWDREFTEVGMHILFKLIKAANYLEIEDLLDLSCKAVANRIKNKDPKEMSKIFNLSPPKRNS